ncbi:MAG: PQQ-like beta-propeller repeat protein [Planctomycetota bacterium]|jgi:outer membrane protein assembly factor BamB|nr:PQQ-like beta-propeller repeat protein [Planctomycetota bacterium]MDP6763282.1 PQQ-like beta-propeller repeat protein [Planctomycetota bacterium]MDP6988036.1 PQQ-like beta-propeller repeat protein [Planctomycetota bacterium]
MSTTGSRRAVRWWIAGAIVALSAAVLAWNGLVREATGQERVMAAGGTLLCTGAALYAWAVLLSRFRARTRLAVLVCVPLLALAGRGLFEVRGVSGNLIPLLRWRLAADPEAGLSSPEAEVAAPAPEASASLDFPRFLGPDADAVVRGVRLARDWEAHPPRLLWRRAVGPGWSGFAVRGSAAITQEQRKGSELVVCYDLLTGAVRWSHADEARFDSVIGGIGPRATPTIHGGRVLTVGGTGILNCLELATGEPLWSHSMVVENGGSMNTWGTSCSPLVVGGRVVVSAGGPDGHSLVAYDLETGEVAWRGGDDGAGYSSPKLLELAGTPQIVIFNSSSVAAHDPGDGRVLWTHPWSERNPNVAQPVPVGPDDLVLSSGYGVGAERLRVGRDEAGAFTVERVWHSRALKAKFANFVLREGHLYGLDDGILACVDAERGRRSWKGGRYGHGQLLLVEDLLLVGAEDGSLVLVEAVSDGHHELARADALDQKTWNSPALAAPYLLVRNDLEAACFELALEEEPNGGG